MLRAMRTLLVVIFVGALAALASPTARKSAAPPSAGRPADAIAPQSPSQPLQVQEHTLDNGFTILVIEDHRTPRVAANL